MNNYIIINSDTIQKRIEELKISLEILQHKNIKNQERINECHFRIGELEEVLSNSLPLIPEIEKSILWAWDKSDDTKCKDDYIEQLNLDI
jgi:hypothetical protein